MAERQMPEHLRTLPNDWEIKKCLRLSLAILLATLGLIGLAALGFDIPGLRQIVGFVFLAFIPGILILRILRVHNIGIVESLVYSVGLSLAFVMFSGAFINFALPFAGISNPISPMPLTAALTALTLILMAVAYMRDRDFTRQEKTEPREKLHLPSVLFLILLLLLTILSVALIDAYQNNVLLLTCIIAIAGVVGLTAVGKFFKPTVYPFVIFIIGLCLLYQTTLMSPHLVGTDIQIEYYFYQLVSNSGFWDASIPSTVNSCLSITILAPVYSVILNVDGLWIFKTIYPLLFALVPLILYFIFSHQMSRKKAFLAAFFFMAVPTFSLEMISLCRQQIAELFFALLILLFVDRKLTLGPKLTLAIVFAVSIPVSHYALGFIGFIYMGMFLPLVLIIRSSFFRKAWGRLTGKFGGLPRSLTAPGALPAKALVIVVVIYFISSFAWYGTIASGANLASLNEASTRPTTALTTTITTDPAGLVDFSRRDELVQTALGLDFGQASPQGKGFRILQYITQLFLIAGCLRLVFRPKRLRFAVEYIALSVTSALLILGCILLPVFASILNTTRWYHIALITLAPFCVLGGEAIWLGASSLWRKLRRKIQASELAEDSQGYLNFLTLAVLIPYFLFTSGFIFEVTKNETTDVIDAPYSIALSSYRLDLAAVSYWRDVAGAEWLAQKLGDGHVSFADSHGYLLLSGQVQLRGRIGGPSETAEPPPDRYMFFRSWNIEKQEVTGCPPAGISRRIGLRQSVGFAELPQLVWRIDKSSKIYDNGGAQVLLEP